MGDWVRVARDLVGSTPVLFIGIFLGSMIMLVIKNRVNFPKDKLWILWSVFIISGSMLISSGIVWGYNEYIASKALKKQIARLNNLGNDEKRCLSHYVIKLNQRAIYIGNRTVCGKGTVLSLEGSQIVSFTNKTENKNENGAYYNIDNWVFEYLQKHPELIKTGK